MYSFKVVEGINSSIPQLNKIIRNTSLPFEERNAAYQQRRHLQEQMLNQVQVVQEVNEEKEGEYLAIQSSFFSKVTRFLNVVSKKAKIHKLNNILKEKQSEYNELERQLHSLFWAEDLFEEINDVSNGLPPSIDLFGFLSITAGGASKLALHQVRNAEEQLINIMKMKKQTIDMLKELTLEERKKMDLKSENQ